MAVPSQLGHRINTSRDASAEVRLLHCTAQATAKALAVAVVESYFVWRGALAFVSDRRYADMSASSWPLSVGSLRPCFVA